MQLAFFIYHVTMIANLVEDESLAGQPPTCSLLIYNPERRYEVGKIGRSAAAD